MRANAKPLETEEHARSYLLDLLARKDYSRAQLEQKLKQRGCAAEFIDPLLNQFAELGYQSDQRFVEAQVRQRLEQGQGRRKIEFELRNKGVSSDLIRQTIDAAEVDPHKQALEYLRRRYGTQLAADQKERAKRTRHMVGRGFSYDEISYAFRYQAENPDD